MTYCNSTRPYNESYYKAFSELTHNCGLKYNVKEGLKNVVEKVSGHDRRRSFEDIFENIEKVSNSNNIEVAQENVKKVKNNENGTNVNRTKVNLFN
uniref:Uncharacterized protein n=1 Tax=Panagrolaimus sp. PS1159 TaxID=55785 RepID=A0AC35FBM8_9BILA